MAGTEPVTEKKKRREKKKKKKMKKKKRLNKSKNATGDGGGAGGVPSMRIERFFSVFWAEAVMAREMSCDIEKEGGMTGIVVFVTTVAILLN
ncbi:hypothetical protein PDIDSM_7756 [Penicillium digitatum]|nr:hypothetical protein PDIDSM_7756 [Penicillium digitatum]